jgi:ring-1,2-phenylacetyl-CoA epoxidase subunit PaaD
MVENNMPSIEFIYSLLEKVNDPEVPVLSILDLGIVRNVIIENEKIVIKITPTYSGCPAMGVIATNIKFELIANGITDFKIEEILSPAWTTDWMSEAGKQKLITYGIAAPQYSTTENPENKLPVPCPQCKSKDTKVISEFGSTSCKSLFKCNECLEAFDYFKCH